jgi:hypothetical protein
MQGATSGGEGAKCEGGGLWRRSRKGWPPYAEASGWRSREDGAVREIEIEREPTKGVGPQV